MAVIKGVLIEELDRLKNMEKVYIEKIKSLPKGSIRYKQKGQKKYPYLKYREGLKIVTDYIKPDINIQELKSKIDQRKKFENNLREIRKDIKLIRKVVKE